MVQYMAILRKRRDWTIDQFHRHWREVHGPLVASLPGIRKYVQYVVMSPSTPASDEDPIDGVAELWFDDKDALSAALLSPAGALVKADVERLFAPGDHYNHVLEVTARRQLV